MEFKYNTGGREKYYKNLNVADCATRATAIANGMDYKDTYKLIWKHYGESPRNGISQTAMNKCLNCLGWKYVDLESKSKTLNEFEIPNEDLIIRIRLKRHKMYHVFAYIDGVINDTWDCSIYNPWIIGYWRKTVC